ncbi:DUF6973 domain-containing protein [Streptomyces sp. MB09-02B]|uniref:DUF6973 domain-containing protein n=1 Tax=Streptomyces sp. MB09-02B TaxID=3028667 RepID=UPI0039B03FBC
MASRNRTRSCAGPTSARWSKSWAAKDAHEKKHKNSKDRAKGRDSKVDYYNNKVGRKIGSQITAWTRWGAHDATCSRCKKALRNRKLAMR